MASIGIRDLKNNLSRVILRVSEGESIDVTDHGRIVARLTPPPADDVEPDGFETLVSAGTIRRPSNRSLLEEDAPARALLSTRAKLVTSDLTFAECARGLVR